MNDLKFAFRQLLKNPGFTAVAVLTLALGICAVTTQFSIFNGVLLRGLPFPEPDRLIRIALRDPSSPPAEESAPSVADFLEWQRQQRSCEQLAASDSYRWLNVTIEGTPRPVAGLFVTHNFFSLLGMKPLIGRDFSEEDDRPGAERVALISHDIWMRDFGGVPNIMGRTLRLEGRVTTVIGVMPPGFTFPGHGAVIVLLAIAATLACSLPARRAAKVDPIVVLRHE